MGPSRVSGGKAIVGFTAAAIVVIVVLGVSTWEDGAEAWEEDPCPMGQTWNESVGACEELEDKTALWVVSGVVGGLSVAGLAFFVGFGTGRRWEKHHGRG